MKSITEVVGLIPAGGQATRISPLPCSKELYPIGFRTTADGARRPKVVSHYLLEKMKSAGICRVFFVLRPGKWDIPAYFGDGSMLEMDFAYLVLGVPYGVPFTLDQAYRHVRHATVAFGFPDILFEGADAFRKLLDRQSETGADLVLGLTPATGAASREDRVLFDGDGSVRQVVLRPPVSEMLHSWVIAVWQPRFTQFVHDFVAGKKTAPPEVEPSAGHAIQAAIEAGLRVQSAMVAGKPYLDIGTPDDLVQAAERERQQ